MDRSSFVAAVVSVGPLEDVVAHVGWAADATGTGPHLMLMRGDRDDDYCVVSGDADTYATHYGGVVHFEVEDSGTTLTFAAQAAAALGLHRSVTIRHRPGDVDAADVRRHLDRVIDG